MDISITNNKAKTIKKIDSKILSFRRNFEGKTYYLSSGHFQFEPTQHNLSVWLNFFPDATIDDRRESEKLFGAVAQNIERPAFAYKTKPYKHQIKAFEKLKNSTAIALFMEQGTGKSLVLINLIAKHYCDGDIDAAIILSPKGVHFQWVEEQLPQHMPIAYEAWAWEKKKTTLTDYKKRVLPSSNLQIVTMNIDAIKTKDGKNLLEEFIKHHNGRVLLGVDEAHAMKNYRADRTRLAIELGGKCSHRAILTGTPIAKNIADLFSEFKFLDEAIIGTRYFTAFRNQYCVTRHNGFAIEIVGAKNLDKLYAKIDPYTFRATKDELDLPPKVYDQRQFEMSPEQYKNYLELKNLFLTTLDNDEKLSVVNTAAALVKLQQITCGFLKKEDGSFHEFPNPRLEALLDVIDNCDGPIIIWSRFNQDIRTIMSKLGSDAVSYYGETPQSERDQAKNLFLSGKKRFFVSNPSAGGTGLNLQGSCTTAIYYSNSFNAVDRWQSEDRIHRIGTTDSVTYIDLICRKSVDGHILKNLMNKKSLSDLALDQVRKMFE